jgi:YD repeat-containing protein
VARVLVASQWWGQLTDKRGNALRDETATLKNTDNTTAVVYAASTGSTPVTAFKSDELGTLPGWVEEGTYKRGTRAGEIQVEAVSGGTRASLASVETSVLGVLDISSVVYGDSRFPDSITSITENGVTRTFTYNADGSVHTETAGGRTRTFSYDGSGNLTGAVLS